MFTPVKNRKVYEVVIEQIKNMVKTGELKKGDKLPPERDLVEQLKVSRTSIREAIRALEILGLIECKQGEGNFIRKSFQQSLLEPLSIMFMLQESTPKEVIELRRILEIETASLAAKHIKEEKLTEIYNIVDTFKNSTDEKLNTELDQEFHFKIAEASENFLLVIIDSFISNARLRIMENRDNREILIQQHEAVYRALCKRDSKSAAEEMKKHLEFVSKTIFNE
jgi:GntR family transcriptional repressor for pyruvate dehydrogenase complex